MDRLLELNQKIANERRYYTDGKAWLAKGLFKWAGVRPSNMKLPRATNAGQ